VAISASKNVDDVVGRPQCQIHAIVRLDHAQETAEKRLALLELL